MKLKLSQEQKNILNNGICVTVKRPVQLPEGIVERFKVLENYPVKSRSQLDGVCGDEIMPLVVGMVRLNIEDSCIEFDAYSQHEVIL